MQIGQSPAGYGTEVGSSGAVRPRRSADVFKTFNLFSIGGLGGGVVWQPAAGKKWRVLGLCLRASTSANLVFDEGQGESAIVGVMVIPPEPATGSAVFAELGGGIVATQPDAPLVCEQIAAANISGMIWGVEE